MTEKLDRYEILEKIGEGGFAIVYRTRDTKLGRLVALKELRPVLLHDTDWVRRFRREARTIAHLDHPHIVTIHDVIEVENRLFLVIQLVDGPGLDELIKTRERLSWPETVEMVTVVAQGLDYAHSKGVLHRDLKPSNILIDPGRGPMLADFGLAKLAGENSVSVTSGGGVVGTPYYIAPEVWEAKGTTPQSDIYALGCILFEMLTGEKVFKGETPPEVMMAHFKPPTLPKTWPEDVPPGIADVLKIALSSESDKRYASAGEFAEALVALSKTEPDPAKSTRALEQAVAPTPQSPPAEANSADVIDPLPEESDEWSSWGSVDETPSSGGVPGIWKGFLAHLGPYLIVITMLGVINGFTSEYPWFLWPALGWGVGVAFHLMGIGLSEMKGVTGQVRGFAGHFGSYAIITIFLVMIYLLAGGGYPWFLWPVGIWGAAIGIHLWTMMLTGGGKSKSKTRTAQKTRSKRKQHREERRRRKRRTRQQSSPEEVVTAPEIASTVIKAHLLKARTYQQQIQALIKSTSDPHSRARLEDLAAQVDEWTEAIEDLAQRVDRFQQNPIIRQDLDSVPRAIEKLETQLASETDEATKAELERTLNNRKNQLTALEHLQSTMRRAEIKIESTLSALGTIYSQILTSQSTNHVADYGRLSADVDEEVRTLQDQLEALEEVKFGSAQ